MKLKTYLVLGLAAGVCLAGEAREDETSETILHKTMANAFPTFRKMGAVCECGEASPFVFRGKLMRMELFDPTCATVADDPRICIRIRDVASGKILSSFGKDCYYPTALADGDKVYVTATKRTYWLRGEKTNAFHSGETIVLYESSDLVNWTSREIITRPGWHIFNTTMTKGPDGYVLAYESNHPSCVPFTMFFATSKNLKTWTLMRDSRAYPAKRYCGGPFLRYHNGYYYLSLVTELPCERYCTYLFRTSDFRRWDTGRYNPFLFVTQDDRRVSPNAQDISESLLKRIPTAFVCSLADVEMCDFDGKTYLNYGIGDQHGFYYWAEAWYDGPVGELLERFFN